MHLVYLILLAWPPIAAHASSTDALFDHLLNAPARGRQDRTTESGRFAVKLHQLLVVRHLEGSTVRLEPLLSVMARFAEVDAERVAIFATLAHPDNGLSAREVSSLLMSGKFRDHFDARLKPARAFDLMMRREPAYVDRRQFEIFAGLAEHVREYEDWEDLALMTGDWSELETDVSEALVSNLIVKLQGWPLDLARWERVLALYRPAWIDIDECRRIVSHFQTVPEVLRAVAAVRDDQTRLHLQEAAVIAAKDRSPGVLRNLLRPLGPNPSAALPGRARPRPGPPPRPPRLARVRGALDGGGESRSASRSIPPSRVGPGCG